MDIPKLMQVGEETSINPANIAVFKDYSNRLEIYTTGGTKVEVKGKWIEPIRKAILQQIPDDDTTTVAPEETTSLIREMCANWKTCAEKPRHDEKCTIKNFFKCYVSNSEVIEEPEAINKIDPTIDPSIDQEENNFEMFFSDTKHPKGWITKGTACPLVNTCLDVGVDCTKLSDNVLTLANIPICFEFMIAPEDCDSCDTSDNCGALNTGNCPVDEITEAKNKS